MEEVCAVGRNKKGESLQANSRDVKPSGKVRDESAEVHADGERNLVEDTSTQQNCGGTEARGTREVVERQEDERVEIYARKERERVKSTQGRPKQSNVERPETGDALPDEDTSARRCMHREKGEMQNNLEYDSVRVTRERRERETGWRE